MKRGLHVATKNEIRQLDANQKYDFHLKKSSEVKRSIIPENSSTLYKAVKVAKDFNTNCDPSTMFESGV